MRTLAPHNLTPRTPTLSRGPPARVQKTRRTGGDAHLPKGTLSSDPMEIKVVQVDLAFKIYRSGETRAHSSSAAWEGEGGEAAKEREGIRSVKSVL